MSLPQTEPFDVDLRGRVSNTRLPESNGLMAVFEAVANAIQAVEEANDRTPGRIDVQIIRATLPSNSSSPGRVVGFRIMDHGIGFNDENYRSFKKSDTTRKRVLGGRGVGRLAWLLVFDTIRVDSEYESFDGIRKGRSFSLSLDGVTPVEPIQIGHRGTIVTLTNPNTEYTDSLQTTADRLAGVLVEHCLLYILDAKSPPIYVVDPGEKTILLRDFLEENFLSKRTTTTFEISGYKFTQIHLLRNAKRNSVHLIHLCAAKRTVKKKRLSDEIPELTGSLHDQSDNRPVVYAGYVVSDLLDARVHPGRDEFWLGQAYAIDGTDAPPLTTITQADIEAQACKNATEFLQPLLGPYREERRATIDSFVRQEAPQFRYIVKKYPERSIAIKANATKLDMYQHLSRIEFEHDKDTESKIGDAIATIDDSKTARDHADEIESLLATVSEGARAKLAKYVLYRRAVINILEKHQGLGEDGQYALEKTVHQTVFPMRRTSDETPYHLWNLWLIDERLAFHRFLASDIGLNDLREVIQTGERDRPDLAIFNRPMGFAESEDVPFGSIVLVDFKRPARKQYAPDEKHEDPVSQVMEYVKKILAGNAVRRDGSILRVPPGTPFYVYVIADLLPPMIDLLKMRSFLELPDKEGYFHYNPAYCAYIEVMPYAKLIADAKKRNRAFFEALNSSPL